MELTAIMESLQKNTAFYVALYTVLLALLSIFLSVQEYYRRKAYYDYFQVEDRFRPGMRSGFLPEYLTYAVLNIVIVTLACTVLFGVVGIQKKEGLIHFAIFGGIAAVAVVSYGICWAIYLLGHSQLARGGNWIAACRAYGASSALYARCKCTQWTIAASMVFLSYYLAKWWNWVFVPAVFVGAVLVFYLGEYFIVQKMIPHHIRQFMAWRDAGKLYILLCSDKVYYCVRASQQGDRLEIFPDEVLLLDAEEVSRSFERIRFASFEVIRR